MEDQKYENEKYDEGTETEVVETTAEEITEAVTSGNDIVGMMLLGLAIVGGGWIIWLIVKGIRKLIGVIKDKAQQGEPIPTTGTEKPPEEPKNRRTNPEKVDIPEKDVEVVK